MLSLQQPNYNIHNQIQRILKHIMTEATKEPRIHNIFFENPRVGLNAFIIGADRPAFMDQYIRLVIVPNIFSPPRRPEAEHFHIKILNCCFEAYFMFRLTSLIAFPHLPHYSLRIAHQSAQKTQELFTISDPLVVEKILKKLHELGKQSSMQEKEAKFPSFLETPQKQYECIQCLRKFKIAWTSNPLIYIDAVWALSWMAQVFEQFYFFENHQHNDDPLNLAHWRNNNLYNYRKRSNSKSLQYQLAVYLKKEILKQYRKGINGNKMAEVKKIKEFTLQNGAKQFNMTRKAFGMTLLEVIEGEDLDKVKTIAQDNEEMFYKQLQEAAIRLLQKQLNSKKQSKRIKRNVKKALQRKKIQESKALLSQTSAQSSNPEKKGLIPPIVDNPAYKSEEHQEILLSSSNPQNDINPNIPEMYNSNSHSNQNQTSSTQPQFRYANNEPNIKIEEFRPKKGNNKQFKRKYEEKHKVEKKQEDQDYQVESKQAVLSFANNIFLSKYYAISNENSDSWDLKSVSYQYLLDYFSARLPCYSISLFGSLATGLSLPTSDVDILITPIEGYPVPESLLGLIANDLYHAPWTSYCNYIPTAKIPVIKLIVDPFFKEIHNPVSKFKGTPLEEQLKLSFLIKFDITINMSGLYNTGMSSTNYMKSVINGQPKIAEVLIVLKYILEMAKLNEGYKGGISSYNLFIMLIGFLEEKQVNVAEISMGEMIIEFFKFFAYEFNPKHSVLRFEMSQKCVLSFQEYMMLPNSENLNKSGPLKLIDPINGKLVRASFSRLEDVTNLFKQFVDVLSMLEVKSQEIAMSLMGKAKRKSSEIKAAIEGELANTDLAKVFASLAYLPTQ